MKIVSTVLLALALGFSAHAKKSGVKTVLQEHKRDVMACFRHALKEDPNVNLAGKIVLDWIVNDAGEVVEATVNTRKSRLRNEGVETCLLDKLRTWKFPGSKKGKATSVSYPFTFDKKEN